MESVAGKGMGMIASRNIKQVIHSTKEKGVVSRILLFQGEIIVKEDPLLVLDLTMAESERNSVLLDQFSKLGERDRRKVEALYDSDPTGEEGYKIMRIFKGNSIQGRFIQLE